MASFSLLFCWGLGRCLRVLLSAASAVRNVRQRLVLISYGRDGTGRSGGSASFANRVLEIETTDAASRAKLCQWLRKMKRIHKRLLADADSAFGAFGYWYRMFRQGGLNLDK